MYDIEKTQKPLEIRVSFALFTEQRAQKVNAVDPNGIYCVRDRYQRYDQRCCASRAIATGPLNIETFFILKVFFSMISIEKYLFSRRVKKSFAFGGARILRLPSGCQKSLATALLGMSVQ